MWSWSRPGLRRSQAIWECPNRGPSGPVFLGKSQTWTRTTGFGLVQTGFQSVWDRTSPTLGTDDGRVLAGGDVLVSGCDGWRKKMRPNTQTIVGLKRVSQRYPSTIVEPWSNGVTKNVRF